MNKNTHGCMFVVGRVDSMNSNIIGKWLPVTSSCRVKRNFVAFEMEHLPLHCPSQHNVSLEKKPMKHKERRQDHVNELLQCSS